MAYTNTPINEHLVVALAQDFVGSTNNRAEEIGVLSALMEDRNAFSGRVISEIENMKMSKDQVMNIDILTKNTDPVVNTTVCEGTSKGSSIRVPVAFEEFNVSFAIDLDETDNSTHQYQNILNHEVMEVFRKLHEAQNAYLENFLTTNIGAPTGTFPYATTGGAITVPLADWDVQQNSVPVFLNKIATLFRQNSLGGDYRMIGNANLEYVLRNLGVYGANNQFDVAQSVGGFDYSFSTQVGTTLTQDGIKSFALPKGEFSTVTWNRNRNFNPSDGGSHVYYTIQDPMFGHGIDVIKTASCDAGNRIESWSFTVYLGGVASNSDISVSPVAPTPYLYSLDFALV